MILYHYCSNAAFLSIISQQQIRASEFSLSNDALEGKWLREVVKIECEAREAKSWEQDELLKSVDDLKYFFGAAGFCLSEEDDLLSQWRAYADNGSGVSIGFDSECFDGSQLPGLHRIEYDLEKQREKIQDTMNRAFGLLRHADDAESGDDDQWVGSEDELRYRRRMVDDEEAMTNIIASLVARMYEFKNPAFKEEKEWRSISLVTPPSEDKAAGLVPVSRMNSMEFRPLIDRIVPFSIYPLVTAPKSAIREIVLGPRNITPPGIVDAALLKFGWHAVQVRKSSASYR